MPAPKLTPVQIAALRTEAPGAPRGWRLRRARELGVSRTCLSQILNLKRHVPKPLRAHFDPQTYAARIWAKLSDA